MSRKPAAPQSTTINPDLLCPATYVATDDCAAVSQNVKPQIRLAVLHAVRVFDCAGPTFDAAKVAYQHGIFSPRPFLDGGNVTIRDLHADVRLPQAIYALQAAGRVVLSDDSKVVSVDLSGINSRADFRAVAYGESFRLRAPGAGAKKNETVTAPKAPESMPESAALAAAKDAAKLAKLESDAAAREAAKSLKIAEKRAETLGQSMAKVAETLGLKPDAACVEIISAIKALSAKNAELVTRLDHIARQPKNTVHTVETVRIPYAEESVKAHTEAGIAIGG